jgi:hypothetical protein
VKTYVREQLRYGQLLLALEFQWLDRVLENQTVADPQTLRRKRDPSRFIRDNSVFTFVANSSRKD